MPQLKEDTPFRGNAQAQLSALLRASTSRQQGGSCHRLSPSGKDPSTSGDLHLSNDLRDLQTGQCSLQPCSSNQPSSPTPVQTLQAACAESGGLWGPGEADLAAASRPSFVNKHLAAMVMLI